MNITEKNLMWRKCRPLGQMNCLQILPENLDLIKQIKEIKYNENEQTFTILEGVAKDDKVIGFDGDWIVITIFDEYFFKSVDEFPNVYELVESEKKDENK